MALGGGGLVLSGGLLQTFGRALEKCFDQVCVSTVTATYKL